jgi:hypothetical protein
MDLLITYNTYIQGVPIQKKIKYFTISVIFVSLKILVKSSRNEYSIPDLRERFCKFRFIVILWENNYTMPLPAFVKIHIIP